MHARCYVALFVGIALALPAGWSLPAVAVADGDPASDVLLGENVFYPYSPPVSAPVAHSLDAVAAAAKHAGFPIKVALIASPVDLGVIPDLFGKPRQYAAFLDQEISFNVKLPLLVVMPAGLGLAGVGSGATATLTSLSRPSGSQPDDLARSAIQAVPKLAAAAGHPIKTGAGANSPGGSKTSSGAPILAVVLVLALLFVLAAVGVVTLRGRRRERAD